MYLSPNAKRATQPPAAPTPDWVNTHASFVYLGGPGLKASSVPDPGEILILHATLADGGTVRYPDGTLHRLFSTISLKYGSAESFDEKMGAAAIESSRQVLEAVRTGGPLPDDRHALRDLTILSDAVRAYAKEHDGNLPPSLGATLAYLKADLLPRDTPQDRARVYLSPAAERATLLPEQPTPEWVDRHASYAYLGSGLTLRQVTTTNRAFILLHANPSEVYHTPKGGEGRVLPIVYPFEYAGVEGLDVALSDIEATKAQIREFRTPTK